MSPQVSILVPVYNVSPYIEKCAHSLFQQTFDDIEYVFVNDCTPDDSIEKLQKVIDLYPNRKGHVKIIHHEKNRGLAAARNTAIDNSTGIYIQHIDSDDYIEPDMLELMYKKGIEENSDIVVCDYFDEFANNAILKKGMLSENKEDNCRDLILGRICPSVWNKLINRNLCEMLACRVPEGLNFLEDNYTTNRMYYYASKIVAIHKPLYHYIRFNNNSICRTKTQMHFENVILFWKLNDKFLVEIGVYDKYENEIGLLKIKNKIGLMIGINNSSLQKEFAEMFLVEEMKVKSSLSMGERAILFYVRHKFFGLLWLHRQLLILKQKFIVPQ